MLHPTRTSWGGQADGQTDRQTLPNVLSPSFVSSITSIFMRTCNAPRSQGLCISWTPSTAKTETASEISNPYGVHSKKFKMNEEVDSHLSEKVSNLLLTWKVDSIRECPAASALLRIPGYVWQSPSSMSILVWRVYSKFMTRMDGSSKYLTYFYSSPLILVSDVNNPHPQFSVWK